ncbi:MAG: carbohydrate ABC transporter permease [Gammaproteobacteria bacterium]
MLTQAYYFIRGRSVKQRRARIGYLFLLPSLFFVAVHFVVPTAYNVVLSFADWHIIRPLEYVGWENYVEVFTSDEFWESLTRTLYFTVLSVPVTITLALMVALGLHRVGRRPGSSVVRAMYFAPVIASLTAVAYIWTWIFNPAYGLLNDILGLLSLQPLQWLNDVNQVIPSLSIMYVWSRLGFDMLILMAGLTAIAPDYYEAARIDGATRWRSFWHITLPLLNHQLVLISVVEMMLALKVFELPYAATSGGPVNASRTLVMHIYETAFQWNRMDEAAVASIALFLIILVITVLQHRLLSRKIRY